MPGGERRRPWRRFVVAGAFAALAWSAAYAKDSTAYVKEAEQYIIQGDLKAAEIQLRNAIREAPQDPVLRARLAEVYLQQGDAQSAERGSAAIAASISLSASAGLVAVNSRASCIFGLAAPGSSLIASSSSVSALARSLRPAAAVPSAVRTLLSRTGARLPGCTKSAKSANFPWRSMASASTGK